MIADEQTAEVVASLVRRTYDAMSTPGSDIAEIFDSPWMNVTGSGQGEIFSGGVVRAAATTIASWGLRWTADDVTVWCKGDVAWAQILGSVHVIRSVSTRSCPTGPPVSSRGRTVVSGGGSTGAAQSLRPKRKSERGSRLDATDDEQTCSASQVPTRLRHPETVPVPVLSGPRVTLRSVEARDRDSRLRRGWHQVIERNYGHARPTGPMSEREADDWLVEQRQLSSDSSRCDWLIDVDGDLAGVAFLHSMSEVDRKARFAIGMFSPEFIGLGLGGEATRLVLGHAFGVLGLHRIDLRVLAFNTAAIRSYERCGFVIEGRERESCWLEDRWHDDVIMGVLAREFAARQPS